MSSTWDSITEETTIQLSKLGVSISFGNPEPKNDAHIKAKTGFSCCNWVFAKRNTDHAVWVELELKPKQGNPQNDLFSYLKKNKTSIEKKLEAPIKLTINGQHRRVSSYLQNTNVPDLNDCVKRMVSFIITIRPYLLEYSKLDTIPEKNVLGNSHSTSQEYQPNELDIENAIIRLSLSEKINQTDFILDEVEKDCIEQGVALRQDWRMKFKK